MSEPLTRPQFIIAMAVHIGVAWELHAKEAIPLARDAYHEFMRDIGFHGHAEYAWGEDAAREVANEYVLAYGEPSR